MAEIVHTSRCRIRKHQGAHRTAWIEDFEEPVHYGMHGGILAFYRAKYGVEVAKELPATLDHIIAAAAG